MFGTFKLGTNGDDFLFGTEQDDVLFGGAGTDVLFANGGRDFLLGGAGDDIYVVGNDGFTFEPFVANIYDVQGHDTVSFQNGPFGAVGVVNLLPGFDGALNFSGLPIGKENIFYDPEGGDMAIFDADDGISIVITGVSYADVDYVFGDFFGGKG